MLYVIEGNFMFGSIDASANCGIKYNTNMQPASVLLNCSVVTHYTWVNDQGEQLHKAEKMDVKA